MKIQKRLALVIVSFFLVSWLFSSLATYLLEHRNARKETIQVAEVLLNVAEATRNYTSEEIDPLLPDNSATFLPQTVPSYAAQQIFSRLDQNFKSYNYVERSLNPTNPRDLAEGWQAEIIRAFIDNPGIKNIIGERTTIGGDNILYVAQPIIIKSPQCLRCHSTPDLAPASQIRTYGNDNGFGWKLNQIVGARLISVPTSIPWKRAQESSFSYALLLASIFLITYVVVSLVLQRWIINPLSSITHLVEEISLTRLQDRQLPEENSDEFGRLSRSINRLLVSLRKSLSS